MRGGLLDFQMGKMVPFSEVYISIATYTHIYMNIYVYACFIIFNQTSYMRVHPLEVANTTRDQYLKKHGRKLSLYRKKH